MKYGCFHYLSQDELVLFAYLDNRYGLPFKIGNAPYKGFWATESGKKGVDAQVVAVAKHNDYIIVTNDNSIHGASYLENIECIRWEELCRRMKNSQPKLL